MTHVTCRLTAKNRDHFYPELLVTRLGVYVPMKTMASMFQQAGNMVAVLSIRK